MLIKLNRVISGSNNQKDTHYCITEFIFLHSFKIQKEKYISGAIWKYKDFILFFSFFFREKNILLKVSFAEMNYSLGNNELLFETFFVTLSEPNQISEQSIHNSLCTLRIAFNAIFIIFDLFEQIQVTLTFTLVVQSWFVPEIKH